MGHLKQSGTGLFLTLISVLISTGTVRAQITSPAADYVDSLSYPVHPGKDPLFVFYQTNQVPKPGRRYRRPRGI